MLQVAASGTPVAWPPEGGVDTPLPIVGVVGERPRQRPGDLTERVMESQFGDLRRFASSAERPGSGSPRTTMFGVHSAVHTASRSAKTSSGAARRAIVYSSSVASMKWTPDLGPVD